MTDDLPRRLVALGDALELPADADLAAGVRGRIAARERSGRRLPHRTIALVAVGFAVVLAGTALAVAPVRHAIERVFDLDGAHVQRVPRLPPRPASGAPRRGLGRRIPIGDARHAASFRALLPGSPATAVYVARDVAGGRISIVRGRTLITEFRGTVGPFLLKQVGPGTRVRHVYVGRGRAVYLSGDPHELLFTDSGGSVRADTVRRAGNVLLWEGGGLIVRIEGAGSEAAALRLARSLR